MAEESERRRSVLTDQDVERIEAAFDRRQKTLFETIGYDVSTAETRMEIHKDHTFIRAVRRYKNVFVTALVTAAGAAAMGAATAKEVFLEIIGKGG